MQRIIYSFAILFLFALSSSSNAASVPYGTWQSDCFSNSATTRPLSPTRAPAYAVDIHGFDAGAYEGLYLRFEDPACTQQAFQVRLNGPFLAGDDAASGTDVPGATPIDVRFATTHFTVYEQQIADYYNTIRYCGHGDWAVADEKDVTGCDGLPDPDVWLYTIFKVEEETMYIGVNDASRGNRPDNRIDRLHEMPYIRQSTQ